MKAKSLLLFILVISISVFSSKGKNTEINDTVVIGQVDESFLEFLIKKQVDSIRLINNLRPLITDSILFTAANSHAKYLNEENLLSHSEKSEKHSTPYYRVRAAGGGDFKVEENLCIINLGTANYFEGMGEGSSHIVHTYIQAARYASMSWQYTPAAIGRILTRQFDITAIRVMKEPNSNVLRVVQLMAETPVGYVYKPSYNLFPYAKFEFEGLVKGADRKKASPHKKHAWKIKPCDDKQLLRGVAQRLEKDNKITLFTRNDSIYLYFSDKKTAFSIFSDKNDGIAVEVIPHALYQCNSMEYYSLAARRNDRCIFNGIVLEPRLYDQLFPDDGSDRLGKKRNDLLISLGIIPGEFRNNQYDFNALILKNKMLAAVIPQTSYMGAMPEYSLPPLPYLDNMANNNYSPLAKKDTLELTIFYEPGDVKGKFSDLKEYFEFLHKSNYIIARANITAYASLEGTLEGNQELFRKRGEYFVDFLSKKQSRNVKLSLQTLENWDKFFSQIEKTKYAFLKAKDTAFIRNYINENLSDPEMISLLDEQRYARVVLLAVPNLSEEAKIKFAIKELELVSDSLKGLLQSQKKNDAVINSLVEHLNSAQLYLQEMYIADNTKRMAKRLIDESLYEKFPVLKFNQIMFNFIIYKENYSDIDLFNELINLRSKKGLPPEYYYNMASLLANNPQDFDMSEQLSIRSVQSMLPVVRKSSIDPELVKQLMLFYHIDNAVKFYGMGKPRAARSSVQYIVDFYRAKFSADCDRQVQLAQILLEFQQKDKAVEALETLIVAEEPCNEALLLYLKIMYENSAVSQSADYYYQLLDALDFLSQEDWCRLFKDEQHIGMQIFDYEPLWKTWCTVCNSSK